MEPTVEKNRQSMHKNERDNLCQTLVSSASKHEDSEMSTDAYAQSDRASTTQVYGTVGAAVLSSDRIGICQAEKQINGHASIVLYDKRQNDSNIFEIFDEMNTVSNKDLNCPSNGLTSFPLIENKMPIVSCCSTDVTEDGYVNGSLSLNVSSKDPSICSTMLDIERTKQLNTVSLLDKNDTDNQDNLNSHLIAEEQQALVATCHPCPDISHEHMAPSNDTVINHCNKSQAPSMKISTLRSLDSGGHSSLGETPLRTENSSLCGTILTGQTQNMVPEKLVSAYKHCLTNDSQAVARSENPLQKDASHDRATAASGVEKSDRNIFTCLNVVRNDAASTEGVFTDAAANHRSKCPHRNSSSSPEVDSAFLKQRHETGSLPVLSDNFTITDVNDMNISQIVHPKQVIVRVTPFCFQNFPDLKDREKRLSPNKLDNLNSSLHVNEVDQNRLTHSALLQNSGFLVHLQGSMLAISDAIDTESTTLVYPNQVCVQVTALPKRSTKFDQHFQAFMNKGNVSLCSELLNTDKISKYVQNDETLSWNATSNQQQNITSFAENTGNLNMNVSQALPSAVYDVTPNQEDLSFNCVDNNYIELLDLGVSSVVEVDSTEELSPRPEFNSTMNYDRASIDCNSRVNYNLTPPLYREIVEVKSATKVANVTEPTLEEDNLKNQSKKTHYEQKAAYESKKKMQKPPPLVGFQGNDAGQSESNRTHQPLSNHSNFFGSPIGLEPKSLLLSVPLKHSEKSQHSAASPVKKRVIANVINSPEKRYQAVPKQARLPDAYNKKGEYNQIQSTERCTDCMLSSSLVNKDSDEACSDLMTPAAGLVSEVEPEFNYPQTEDSKNADELFGGDLVVEPRVATKRTLSTPDLQTSIENTSIPPSGAKRQRFMSSDMPELSRDGCSLALRMEKKLQACLSRESLTSVNSDEHEILHSDVDCLNRPGISNQDNTTMQDTFSMLTSTTNSFLLQRKMFESIEMDEFLRDYTDVRFGNCKKCIVSRPRSISASSCKVPETFSELITAVYCRSKLFPIYRAFLTTIRKKMQSMEGEIARLEKVIAFANPDVMKRIRFATEPESEKMRSKVENLARICKTFSKACWKASKSKLKAGVRHKLEQNIRDDLRPMLERVQAFDHPRNLLQQVATNMVTNKHCVQNKLQSFQERGKPSSAKQAQEYKQNKRTIASLVKDFEDAQRKELLRESQHVKTLKGLQELQLKVDAHEKKENANEKDVRENRGIKSLKRYLPWNILKEDTSEICFGFLNDSFLFKVYSSSGGCDQGFPTAFLINVSGKCPSDISIYTFLHGLIKLRMNAWIKRKSPQINLHEMLAVLSRHACQAKILRHEILEVMSNFDHCSAAIQDTFIIVSFYSRKPYLCNFQVKFQFADSDLNNNSMETSCFPLSYKYMTSRTTFGRFSEREVTDAMKRISPRTFCYFKALVFAIIRLIETP